MHRLIDLNTDFVLWLGELNGIAEQVDQNLLTAHLVHHDPHVINWQVTFQLDLNVLSLRVRLEELDNGLNDVSFECLLGGTCHKLFLVEQALIQISLDLIQKET